MANLFLPAFPEVGFTTDYIDSINAIFAAIATHTHVPEVNVDGSIDYPNGNQVESDSINWNGSLFLDSLLNAGSISFIPSSTSIPTGVASLFVKDAYNNLYFQKVGVSPAIQITNNAFVAAGTVTDGVMGDLGKYQVSLNFNTVNNEFTFSSPQSPSGFVNILEFITNVTNMNAKIVTTTTLNLTNTPNLGTVGYAYFTDDYVFTYAPNPIEFGGNTIAASLVFDNLCTWYNPPVGFGTNYPSISSVTNQITLYRYNPGESGVPPLVTQQFYIQDAIWFPVVANDELVAGNIKSAFYCEPFSNIPNWQAPELFITHRNRERWVWVLNSSAGAQSYTNFSRIIHYNFTIFNSYLGQLKTITNWSDCLLENTTNSGAYIEKYILIDMKAVQGATNANNYLKFNYIYDMGTLAV